MKYHFITHSIAVVIGSVAVFGLAGCGDEPEPTPSGGAEQAADQPIRPERPSTQPSEDQDKQGSSTGGLTAEEYVKIPDRMVVNSPMPKFGDGGHGDVECMLLSSGKIHKMPFDHSGGDYNIKAKYEHSGGSENPTQFPECIDGLEFYLHDSMLDNGQLKASK